MAKRFVYVKGTDIKRQTAREYKFAVVVFIDEKPSHAISYCGNMDLAQKSLKQFRSPNIYYTLSLADLRILEVEER